MNLSILCSDPKHPVIPHLQAWVGGAVAHGHEVQLVYDKSELDGGDILFLVSCAQIVRPEERGRYKTVLVLHASDLPQGRGWSPHIWSIVDGASLFVVSLIEAAEPVDSGAVWLQAECRLEGHELLPEIEAKLFAAELSLMTEAVKQYAVLRPRPQLGEPGPYRRKRTPADSRLDPAKSLAEQFDLLRVVDERRFPAFFDYRGHRYLLKIEKAQP
jgi:methionyl-tRNA formyltransferase